MARFFRVRNYERFQHYKDRNPPWIKLYNDILGDYDHDSLPDASKAHLHAIWLLASRSGNRIPLDPAWIGKKIGATETVNLDVLFDGRHIEMIDEETQTKSTATDLHSNSLAEPYQSACLEKETEEEGETEEERKSAPSAAPVVSRQTSNTRTKGTRLADDWEPDETDRSYAEQFGWDAVRIADEGANIRDWSRSSRNGVKLDWHAAWRSWVRRRNADAPLRGRKPSIDRTASDRAGILAALAGELAGDAGGLCGERGTTADHGDGADEPASGPADPGSDGETGGRESLRGSDGQAAGLGADVRGRRGPGRNDGDVPRNSGGPAGRSADEGYRSHDSDARLSQPAEAAGNPHTGFGGTRAPEEVADSGAGGATDPLGIPAFLREREIRAAE